MRPTPSVAVFDGLPIVGVSVEVAPVVVFGYGPAMADLTENASEQVTPAPIPAPLTLRLTAFAKMVTGNPVQDAPPVTVIAPPVATRLAGKASENTTFDSACDAFGLVIAIVNVEFTPMLTATGAKDLAMVGRLSKVADTATVLLTVSVDVTPPMAIMFR